MVVGHGRVLNVASSAVVSSAIAVIRRIRKLPGRDHVAMDPAADVLIRRDEAQRCDVADRNIQHQAAAAVGAAAGGLRGVDVGRPVEVVELGRIGDQFNRAAHGSGAVESALRPAQYLGAIEIVEVGVDDRAAVERHCGRRQGCFIEVEAHRRHGAAGGGQAAHFVLGLARSRRAQRDPGMAPTRSWIDVMFCSMRSPALKARHRDRRRLHGRFALFGGDDDLFQFASAFGRRRARTWAGRGGRRIGNGRRAKSAMPPSAAPSSAKRIDRGKRAAASAATQQFFHVLYLPEKSTNGHARRTIFQSALATLTSRAFAHPLALFSDPLVIRRLNS